MDGELRRLAQLLGVEPGYHDIWGHWREASEETLRALLAAMGLDARDAASAEHLLRAQERRAWQRVVPAISVLRARQLSAGVRIQLDEGAQQRPLSWRINEESGESREERFTPLKLAVLEEPDAAAGHTRAFALPLPADLPEGYHRLSILEGDSILGSGLVAVVPERCYQPAAIAGSGRIWGCTLQLYGVRSARNAGIGNFTELRQCAEIWGRRGAGLLGTSPLHALSLRDPGHASPYSPSSRLFFNPLYIDVEAVPDFLELAASDRELAARWRARCARLRESPEVDYAGVAAAKREMFERLYENFRARHLASGGPRSRAFAQFRQTRGPALRRHATHEALADFHGKSWREWPAEHRDPASEGTKRFCDEHPERIALHEYLQWIAQQQLASAQARCRESGMPIGLYADLAVSIAPDGSEAWANQQLYVLGAQVGAPPDEFNAQGQDWGLPPLSPQRLKDAAFAPFIATLRANMAHAGALRIDHVMGLSRLWWVPAGRKPSDGAYVRYPVDDLLGLVALESHRNHCLVIGEDLGTVSDELRGKLADADVLSYRLLLFERSDGAFRPPREYPRRALVAWSTHDLPTLTGWWEGRDIDTRAAAGLIDEGARRRQAEERGRERAALVDALVREGLAPAEAPREGPATGELGIAVHSWLARTPAAVMVVQMEDVLGIAEQANLPGTIDQHPNWKRKLPTPIEEWPKDPRIRALARHLGAIRGGRRDRRDLPAGLEKARIPRATYRLQLHGKFTFRDATALLPYLAALGVSHVYCSPYLRARPGSTHGYDIVDHEAINPDIGTREDFDGFVAQMKRLGLEQVMDIVPNHMGVLAADNAWWQDVLENGPSSPLADFFDIDWKPPSEYLHNRVLLPVLGDHYGVELAAGRLKLRFDPGSGAFAIDYFVHRLPVDPVEYPRILAPAVRELEAGADHGHQAAALRSIMEAFGRLPRRHESDRARMDERRLGKEVAKGRLASLARSNAAAAAAIERSVEAINGRLDDPASFDALHDLLERQPFRLAYWRVAQDDINYRRFFDINDLAALRQEHAPVFDATHRLILRLVREGAVDGLRVDHPDGLYDPRAYFRKLQERCGRPTYVLVEKIVAPFENLNEEWAVHGTTGYRFANVVNGLFVDTAAEARLSRTYHAFVGDSTGFPEIAFRSKRLILRSALASELTVLTSRLARIARADRSTRDFTFTTLREGLTEVIAAFPVYRTYVDDQVDAEDKRYIDWAVTRARSMSRAADVTVFDFLRDALTCELPARSPAMAVAVRHFARKFQQLTSPVMAKGVEDTAFYVYNRLVSLNDVGGDPGEFGFPPARFHKASAHRARHWPHTMLATSTHDNKRSEDVRARIDVISEMPGEWRLRLRRWSRMNAQKKALVEGAPAPSANDEYLLYQTLLGSLPVGPGAREGHPEYVERIVAYMSKAMREAKRHSSWANVNSAYEQATHAFVKALLDDRPDNAFLADLRAAAEPLAWAGIFNSLSMTAVKLTSPGVPDTYQGNELFDFSLVDPDNRRPVDYDKRRRILEELERIGDPPDDALASMLASPEDGRVKMYVIWRLLELRKGNERLFRLGGYTPVRTLGTNARHVVAYARRQGRDTLVTVVPRLTAALGVRPRRLPCGDDVWGDTRIELAFLKERAVLTDPFTNRAHTVHEGGLSMGDVLRYFPVAVLVA